jgi:DNA end-binding protein Ku
LLRARARVTGKLLATQLSQESAMAMRATWKGEIQLGRRTLGVKLYAAVEDAHVHFHLLHASDRVRVEQHLVDPDSGKIVESDQVRRGYALGGGKFVILSEEELRSLRPEASRAIEVLRFVPLAALAPAWFERPYFLGPDGSAAEYRAFARALAKAEQQVVVHWVMRNRSYTGALRASGEQLQLFALRDRDEVIEAPKVELPAARAPSDKELALAEQLVAALESEFDPSEFHSDYQARVRELVESKAAGKHLRLVKPHERKRSAGSLEQVLRASLSRSPAKEKKSA